MCMQVTEIVSKLKANGRSLWIVAWTVTLFLLARGSVDPWYRPWSGVVPIASVVWLAGIMLAWSKRPIKTGLGLIAIATVVWFMLLPSISPQILIENATNSPIQLNLHEVGTGRHIEVTIPSQSGKRVMFEARTHITNVDNDWRDIVIAYAYMKHQRHHAGFLVLHSPDKDNTVGRIRISSDAQVGDNVISGLSARPTTERH